MNKIKSIYSLIIGTSIIALWIMLFTTGQIPELKTEPINIMIHVISEVLTAVMLIITGIAIIKKSKIAPKLFCVASGMLLYSVINAAGYYGQNGDTAMIIMFAVIFICTTYFLISVCVLNLSDVIEVLA